MQSQQQLSTENSLTFNHQLQRQPDYLQHLEFQWQYFSYFLDAMLSKLRRNVITNSRWSTIATEKTTICENITLTYKIQSSILSTQVASKELQHNQ